MTWKITPSSPIIDDAEAFNHLAAVEIADGQTLEPGVRVAVNSFVKGCKADGTWSSIKAACILAGARTLAGALVPLRGTAPTNVNSSFVTADYNRKTGLIGNGSNKSLNTNRNNNEDPRDSKHLVVYASSRNTADTIVAYIGTNTTLTGPSLLRSQVAAGGVANFIPAANGTGATINGVIGAVPGFMGVSRVIATQLTARSAGANYTQNVNSVAPGNESIFVFRLGGSTNYSNARIAYYSIGESLDLALYDSRVTTLMAAIAAAIP